jgi:tripartite-type tricarboxylate transporter receptor subunit TctC
MSIGNRRRSGVEPPRTGSKIRPTQRRPIKAATLRIRVNAAELARRKFLHLAAGAATLPALSRSAEAQAYPTRPITVIVPGPAGGQGDALARVLGEQMRHSLGQPIILENVSGAGGSIGTGRLARARPDGYTMGLGFTSTHVLNGALYALPYNVLEDFAPISPVGTNTQVLFAKKTMPAKDLGELLGWLSSNPMKTSAGLGATSGNLLFAVFQKQTGIKFTFVPYRGNAPALQDLEAGQIDLFFGPSDALPLMQAGSIKAYAIASDTRLAAAPDIPTFAEMGLPAISYSGWYGLFAPKGMPKEIIDRLNAAAVEALANPALQSHLASMGVDVYPRERQTPEALGALMKADAEKWWPIIREFGIKAE